MAPPHAIYSNSGASSPETSSYAGRSNKGPTSASKLTSASPSRNTVHLDVWVSYITGRVFWDRQ